MRVKLLRGQTSPRSRPTASATSARERTPSLPNSRLMWLSTVFSDRNSSAAISLLVRPERDQVGDLALAAGEAREPVAAGARAAAARRS